MRFLFRSNYAMDIKELQLARSAIDSNIAQEMEKLVGTRYGIFKVGKSYNRYKERKYTVWQAHAYYKKIKYVCKLPNNPSLWKEKITNFVKVKSLPQQCLE